MPDNPASEERRAFPLSLPLSLARALEKAAANERLSPDLYAIRALMLQIDEDNRAHRLP